MQLPNAPSPTALDLANDAMAMNKAALSEDYDEARFRVVLIVRAAEMMGQAALLKRAIRARESLGPFGTPPPIGYGVHLNSLSILIAVVAAARKR